MAAQSAQVHSDLPAGESSLLQANTAFMKFTIARADLESLLKAIVSRPREGDTVTLSACAARVFVECKGNIAGIEERVLALDSLVTDASKLTVIQKQRLYLGV